MVDPALQPGVSLREAGGMEGECEPCLQTGPGRHLGGWCPLRRPCRGRGPGKLGRETRRTHGKADGGLERVAWPRNYGFWGSLGPAGAGEHLSQASHHHRAPHRTSTDPVSAPGPPGHGSSRLVRPSEIICLVGHSWRMTTELGPASASPICHWLIGLSFHQASLPPGLPIGVGHAAVQEVSGHPIPPPAPSWDFPHCTDLLGAEC